MKLICFCLFFLTNFSLFGFYAEFNQDKFVYDSFFSDKDTPGVFVDVGSHNGVSHSNSLFFEKHLGWQGICIEPNPELFSELQASRKCICLNVACANVAGMQQFTFHPCNFMSGLSEFLSEPLKKDLDATRALITGAAREVLIPCELLNDILNRYAFKEIDFLSIDTEGADFAILTSIDFEKYHIKVIAVEGEPSLFANFMESKGYVSCGRYGNDAIFYKKDFYKK